jgi:hypothetical protein
MKVIEQMTFLQKYIDSDSCKRECCLHSENDICFNCWILKYIHRKLKPIIESIIDAENRTSTILETDRINVIKRKLTDANCRCEYPNIVEMPEEYICMGCGKRVLR